ncbi:MAG: class I SAM-dependent methyltransferase [Candidatus Hermodarchaeota archaeon]
MNKEELFKFLVSEAKHPFSGWDFSHLNDRVVNGPLTWSYRSKILPIIRKADSLLDMGTGGGEFLASLMPLPSHTCATEGYEPNVSIARNLLESLGVKVYPFKEDTNLPFNDEEFDVIINRHESYSPEEVYRLLKPGGYFVTQQVGVKNDSKLRYVLTDKEDENEDEEWKLENIIKKLESSGFRVLEREENITSTRIYDVGAIVYYFKAIPWELPDFSVEKYHHKLEKIHDHIVKNGYLDLDGNNHRLFVKAIKPII